MLLLWVTRAAQNQFALIWGPYQIFLFFFSSIEYLNTSPLPNQPNSYLVIQICLTLDLGNWKEDNHCWKLFWEKESVLLRQNSFFCFLSCESDYGNFRTPDGMWEDGCCLRNLFWSVCWSLAIPGWAVDKSCDSYLITIGQGVR